MITLDTTANGEIGTANSLTFAHTCSGANRILIVGVGVDRNPADGDIVTGVTYNGVAMTLVDKQAMVSDTFSNRYAYLYYLIAPATGANNVVVSASVSTSNLRGVSVSYTGVLQSSQPDASSKVTDKNLTTKTLSTTLVTPQSWLVGFAQGSSFIPTASTGITARTNITNIRIGDSNGGLSAGVNSMTWNAGGSTDFNIIQASIKPVPDTSGASFLMNFV